MSVRQQHACAAPGRVFSIASFASPGRDYFAADCATLQRDNTENSKPIFPEKELRGLSPNFHFHVSVNDLYIPTNSLPILVWEKLRTDPGNRSQTHKCGN